MRSINKVIIIGNLTRNPELRQTPNGQSVTTFGVATNREWMTKNGERHDSAEFHECVAWSHLAEICNEYLHKGHLVYIEGYLKTRSWDGPDGNKKFKTEIVVKDMIKLEKAPRSDHYENHGEHANHSETQSASPESQAPESHTESQPDAAEFIPDEEEENGSDLISKDLGL